MSTIASLITSLTIVYSTVYSDADQRKHQSPASLAFVPIHRRPVNSPHKWPVTRKMFPFDDVIMHPNIRVFQKMNFYELHCAQFFIHGKWPQKNTWKIRNRFVRVWHPPPARSKILRFLTGVFLIWKNKNHCMRLNEAQIVGIVETNNFYKKNCSLKHHLCCLKPKNMTKCGNYTAVHVSLMLMI